ncbi:MAG: 2-C-methyl-D-erythritol 2,4-cyclodiphosphate synthase [Deltaproteobacteria bacterium]|nr:2-C-methyl-D-erythritol 2,4-cyclodiphosphate synthase [Deltaproteobacteria bacterium]
MRIGIGYDVHKLAEGRKLVIGGVEIPHEKGLSGHSDADVLLHAVCDALLGAAGLGDIGRHFPDTDPRYQGIDSLKLLGEVAVLLSEKGYRPANIDSVIITEAPKMAPYREKMRQNIATALGLEPDCVNVKATTEEGMGFTGTKQGIAAWALATLESLRA